jgi:hypothetical protein
VKTENCSACEMVNYKVGKSAITLYLSVIKKTCNQGAIKFRSSELEPVIFVMRTSLHVIF